MTVQITGYVLSFSPLLVLSEIIDGGENICEIVTIVLVNGVTFSLEI